MKHVQNYQSFLLNESLSGDLQELSYSTHHEEFMKNIEDMDYEDPQKTMMEEEKVFKKVMSFLGEDCIYVDDNVGNRTSRILLEKLSFLNLSKHKEVNVMRPGATSSEDIVYTFRFLEGSNPNRIVEVTEYGYQAFIISMEYALSLLK
jgi:hypothetical protein